MTNFNFCNNVAGGLVHLRDGANTQYATSSAFLFTVYGELLEKYRQKVTCGSKEFSSSHILSFAKKQVSTYTYIH